MFEPETRTPSRVPAGVAELDAVVHSFGFWRLVPDSVPRLYAPVTPELLLRVEQALKRVAE